MPADSRSPEPARIQRERDLYQRLLSLGVQTELAPLLEEALTLVVEVTGARQGYLELHGEEDRAGQHPWWIAHGFSANELEIVRAVISHGIIAQALATGRTIETPSALVEREVETRRRRQVARLWITPRVVTPPVRVFGTLHLRARPRHYA